MSFINAASGAVARVAVSVVIPCYQCSSTIARALASIEQQSVKPEEVILVDDASDGTTLQDLREIAQASSGWIRLLQNKENRGAAYARNVGWDAASQPYVAFLDADDAWHPEKLRIQYEYMRDNPDVAVSGHQCVWLREDEIPPAVQANQAATRISALSLVFRSCFSTPTVMLKKDISLRFSPDKRYSEDLNLWQRVAFSGLLVVRLESPLAYIYKAPYGEGGLSSRLWEMEKGELSNLEELYRAGNINLLLYVAAITFSGTKYIKRLLFTGISRHQ